MENQNEEEKREIRAKKLKTLKEKEEVLTKALWNFLQRKHEIEEKLNKIKKKRDLVQREVFRAEKALKEEYRKEILSLLGEEEEEEE